jgi:cytochrome c oxidase cbb3-type subunit 3
MNTKSKYKKGLALMAMAGLFAQSAVAQEAAAAPGTPEKLSVWTSGGGILMVGTIVMLAAVIFVLGKILKTLINEDTIETYKAKKAGKGLSAVIILTMLSFSAQAQDAAVAAAPNGPSTVFGMESVVFWAMAGVLVFEFIVLMVLCYVLYAFLIRKGLVKPATASSLPKWLQWDNLVGNDTPMEKEADLMFDDHDFDGIQELDNGMPPMLKYIFVATILFAIYYWVDYHVLYSSPLQLAEYEMQLKEGELQKAEYLKKAGASVDENTVTLLTDASMIDAGAKIYATNCVACHGDKGQGGVGPNLTDKFWLHGGDIKSVFKTIKYGIPDKGMRAWQSEIKPADMQAVSSFIMKNLANTNVAGGKAPQGDEFVPEANAPAAADSAATPVADTSAAK